MTEQTEQKVHRGPYLVLSCPFTLKVIPRDKNWKKELESFKRWCNKRGRPAFASLYWFKKADINAKAVDRDSAIVDCIKCDIDGDSHKMGNDDPKSQLNRLQDWLDNAGMDYEINFSGSDGYGIYIPFPEAKVKNAYKVVSQLYKRFAEITNVNIDKGAMNGTQQKFRLVNSKHQRSGLYAIPLTKEEARLMSIDDIRKLAERPRVKTEEADAAFNELLTTVCYKYDDFDFQFGLSKENATSGYTGFLDDQRLRPCTRLMMEKNLSGWYAMNMVSWELIAAGFSDEEIHTWSKRLGESTGRYDAQVTQYHLDRLRPKIETGDLFIHGCNTIKAHGFCVNGQCPSLAACRKFEEEKVKKPLREHMKT